MSMLEVCLVRHGQSVSNAAGVWQGQGDSPLSEIGRTQVEGLGRALAGQHYDVVLSSDLSRAADKAKASGVEVEHDRDWREIHAREILNTKKRLNEILASHTGQDVETVRHDTERDKFLSALEAKEYGIVDQVIMPRKELGVAPAA